LSFPEIFAEISRPGFVDVKGIERKFKLVEFRAGGLLARAIQHEADHLNGILFIDRMSKKTKEEIREELERSAKGDEGGVAEEINTQLEYKAEIVFLHNRSRLRFCA